MNKRTEKGIALVMTLILVFVMSVMAISLMFISQSETWSSLNYRLMSQARDAAEGGVNAAANFLIENNKVQGGAGDPIGVYTMTTSPVKYSGSAVILGSATPNYPISSVKTNFNSAATGTLAAGNVTETYAAYATLLSMQQINVYGSITPKTIQTWQITSDGTVNSVQNSKVEVSAILETQAIPAQSYGLFASSATCGAVTFSGNASMDSYLSTNIQYNANGTVITQQSGGTVGTNGNFTETGSTTVYGTLSSPRTGVGTCNNGNPDAWTSTGQATVTGGLIKLPQPVVYPVPDAPSPLPPTTTTSITKNNGCNGLSNCAVVNGNEIKLSPGSFGNLQMTGGATMHLVAGTYVVNSMTFGGSSSLIIDSGPVILNLAGQSQTTVLDLTGGSVTNSSLSPMNFQVMYAGSGNITITGGSKAAGIIYAPASTFKSAGGTDWFGAVVANTITDTGGTGFHYDRKLQSTFYVVGNPTLESFTWKKW
jgi:PilX N-terminal